jgi:RHH-type proline utilization regulon transcriptional repressor/proline dehydrogenase/delta 1-pyrroline-5-carboxylate dehydrogenase
MTPFRNEPPADFDAAAIAAAETEFFQRKSSLRDVSTDEAAGAVSSAARASKAWGEVPVPERAGLLFKTAEILQRRRPELTALILLEVHKNWKEADADVCEAIDFLEYYAREALKIASEGTMIPAGVAAVIAPWNFPLAILTGMTAAALVTGNTVLMKPAEQAPVIASVLFEILARAGLPKDVVRFLPGPGETVGDLLTRSSQVDLVCFTGSKEVGLAIASRGKRVIAEMGGKNAIIVDDSADVDRAVEDAVLSAFGFQGQKCSACSRLLPLPGVYEEFKEKFAAAVSKIAIGDPRDPANFMGPVIDAEAEAKCRRYLEIGRKEGRVLVQGNGSKEGYVPPTVFEEVAAGARIAREEIFGPIVTLIRAKDLSHALEVANGVPYDLTGGLFSKDEDAIERARKEFEVGNLYINRKITGALVACQPFGGYRLSSLGFKAGGPEYLYQFLKSPKMPDPPAQRTLPSVNANEQNELLYIKEGGRLLGKTISFVHVP